MSIFTDLRGSITAGKFYHDILTRPSKSGWKLYIFLVILAALILSVYWGINVNSYAQDIILFYQGIGEEVVFENGKIANMPLSHKEFKFNDITIHADRKYTEIDSLAEDLAETTQPAIFIGPEAAYIVTRDNPTEIPYPADFSETVNLEYLQKTKTMVVVTAFVGGFIVWLLIKFIESMLYILLIIAPILLFKFRRLGLTYGEGIKISLYLVTYQIIISTILMLLGIAFIWVHLLFIILYIFVIGAYINIDLTHSKRQLYRTSDS